MKGYFFCADMLGFSNIVNNLDSQKLDLRVKEWVEFVSDMAAKHGIEKSQLISDTVFAGVPLTDKSLQNILNFARDMLNLGVRKSFPIRGSITRGDFFWGKLTYGRPIIQAHQLEANQEWIGVTCGHDVIQNGSDYNDLGVLTYAVPMKNGPIALHPVVKWDVPKSNELVKFLVSNGLTTKPGVLKQLDWKWGSKFNNTIVFRQYSLWLEKNSYDPDKFYGTNPLEFLDQ